MKGCSARRCGKKHLGGRTQCDRYVWQQPGRLHAVALSLLRSPEAPRVVGGQLCHCQDGELDRAAALRAAVVIDGGHLLGVRGVPRQRADQHILDDIEAALAQPRPQRVQGLLLLGRAVQAAAGPARGRRGAGAGPARGRRGAGAGWRLAGVCARTARALYVHDGAWSVHGAGRREQRAGWRAARDGVPGRGSGASRRR